MDVKSKILPTLAILTVAGVSGCAMHFRAPGFGLDVGHRAGYYHSSRYHDDDRWRDSRYDHDRYDNDWDDRDD